MKKLFALILTLTLVLLSGCTNTPAPVSSDITDLSSAEDTASVSSVESVVSASSETTTTSTAPTSSKVQTTTSKQTVSKEPTVAELVAKPGSVIPKGATYYERPTKTTHGAGANMPSTVSAGDVFRYGDYKYTFIKTGAHSDEADDGWSVELQVLALNKASYGELIGTINGKHLKTLDSTFQNNTKMKTAPAIPDTVESMFDAFQGATALTKAPKLPKNLKRMYATFEGCKSLTTLTEIPSGVTFMKYAFGSCTSLKDASNITIPASCTTMSLCFSHCTALEKGPKIAEGVQAIDYAFRNCSSLKTAPKIPSSVKYLTETFINCTSLTGNVVIDGNPTDYTDCFKGVTKPITITGATTLKQELLATQTAE